METTFGERLSSIRGRVAEACARVDRSVDEVHLLPVAKTFGPESVIEAAENGLDVIGENRVQEAGQKIPLCPGHLTWHMVGHLQRNKVKAILQHSDLVHSVDSLRLAEEIDRRAEQMGKVAEVLLQVNCSQERQKYGVAVGASTHLAEQVCTLPNTRLIGLMAMAPLVSDAEKARPTFVRLREIFEEMRREKIGGEVVCSVW